MSSVFNCYSRWGDTIVYSTILDVTRDPMSELERFGKKSDIGYLEVCVRNDRISTSILRGLTNNSSH